LELQPLDGGHVAFVVEAELPGPGVERAVHAGRVALDHEEALSGQREVRGGVCADQRALIEHLLHASDA